MESRPRRAARPEPPTGPPPVTPECRRREPPPAASPFCPISLSAQTSFCSLSLYGKSPGGGLVPPPGLGYRCCPPEPASSIGFRLPLTCPALFCRPGQGRRLRDRKSTRL